MANLSISKRLMLVVGVLLALLLAVALAGERGIARVTDQSSQLLNIEGQIAEKAAACKSEALMLRRYEKDMFLNVEKPEKVSSYHNKWDKANDRLVGLLDEIEEINQDKGMGARITDTREALASYADGMNEVGQMIAQGEITTPQAGNKAIGKYKEAVRAAIEESGKIAEMAAKSMYTKSAEFVGFAENVRFLVIVFVIIALVIGTGAGTVIAKGISGPIVKLAQAAEASANGDIDHEVEVNDRSEIGQLAESIRAGIEARREESWAADAVQRGDLSVNVNADSALGRCVVAIKAVVEELNGLGDAAVAGQLSTRGDAGRHAGEFGKLVEKVNSILDAVVKPVQETGQVLEKLSQYDLTARVEGSYAGDLQTLVSSLNTTANVLHDAISRVSQTVEQVSSAGNQIASTSQSLAQGSSEQAASLEETSSSLEEMSSMTKHNADNTSKARNLAGSAGEAAQRGNHSIARLSESMTSIQSAAEGTAQIIGDINEIAFQTNLLALNAAVEAARAGDAGRGFAVVAEEVRNLALRSKEAAQRTESLIRESVESARQGSELSAGVVENLTEIDSSVGKVSTIVNEIAVASEEQARGIEQVNKAVTQMDQVVQQTAAHAEESASAAQSLAGQSTDLEELVSQFRIDRSGTAHRRLPAHSSFEEQVADVDGFTTH